MTKSMAVFYAELVLLLRKHQASLYYTTDDDGMWAEIGDERLRLGYLRYSERTGLVGAGELSDHGCGSGDVRYLNDFPTSAK